MANYVYHRGFVLWYDTVYLDFYKYEKYWEVEVTYFGLDYNDNDFEVTKSWRFNSYEDAIAWVRDLFSSGDHAWEYFVEEYEDEMRDAEAYYDDYDYDCRNY